MGVDGCWCAPRSSKPVRGVKSLSGEFDSHMLPPEPRGRVPRGFLKNVDFPLDRTEGSSYNTTVRDVSRTTSSPGVAQLVARMVRDHEAVGSNPATRTMQSVLIGSEYPVMDTLLFYFLQSSYRNLFRGVAECYAFSRFQKNVPLRDFPAIRHLKGTDAVIVNAPFSGAGARPPRMNGL